MSQIFSEIAGAGEPLVVIHGWGMNQQIWLPVKSPLESRFQVTWLDLPGHGRSQAPMESLTHTVALLKPHIPDNAIILGWSLGGLVAQALANALPERVRSLILLASTPKFITSAHWQHGLEPQVLQGFADHLQQDYQATVKRFFALQFMGVKGKSQGMQQAQEAALQYPASLQGLHDGLTILRDTDFSQCRVSQPVLWLLGELDRLIPPSLAQGLQHMGYHNVTMMPKASHVPFITHPEAFLTSVENFIDEL